MRLWKRAWTITVGNHRISGGWQPSGQLQISHDAAFLIEKDTSALPNRATLRVWNLPSNIRASLESARETQISIEAGYQEQKTQLFTGDVRRTQSMRKKNNSRRGKKSSASEGVDIITTFEAQDAGRAYSSTRIQKSWGANTTVIEVLREIVAAMGVGEGNLSALTYSLEGAGSTYPEGTVISGVAWRELDRLIRSCGYRWSVQDGNLQILENNRALRQRAIHLTPTTGLIGDVAVAADNTIEATALLIPGLNPGRQIVLDRGSYRVKRVKYQGDTAGQDWFARLTLEAY